MKHGKTDLKRQFDRLRQIRPGWPAAAAVVLLLVVRWVKKISGFDELGITAGYPAVPGAAVAVTVISAAVLAAVSIYVLRAKQFSLHRMYLLCGLLVGSLYLVVLPPLSAPDEWAHYISAYKISNYLTGTEAVNEEGYIMVQAEEMSANAGALLDAGEYQYFWENYLRGETNNQMVPSNQKGNQTFIASYVPQALGITLARILNLNFASRILFGRIFNLIWSVLAVSLAIKWIPFGKKIMFGVAMLPMTLHELASNSYDAWIIAFSLLFIAYCMKLAYEKERVENRDIAVLACLIGLLAPCKIIYTPLIGLCLLIPREKFGELKRWAVSAAVVLGAVIVMMLLVNGQILGGYLDAEVSDNYVGWADEQGYTFSYFLEHPIELPLIMLNTLKTSALFYVNTMLGWRLGQMDPNLQMPNLFYLLLIVLLLFCFLPVLEEKKMFRKGNKAWMLVLIGAVVFLGMYSMLVAWTPISSDVITGVQGRYFLPVLPLGAMVVFSEGNIVLKRDNEKLLSVAYAAFHLFFLAEIFGQVLMV